MLCSNCSQENPDGAVFCFKCGKNIEQSHDKTVACPSCGRENQSRATFCAYCGKPVRGTSGLHPHGPEHAPGYTGQSLASNIVVDIILTVITCGIYWFFWQARQIKTLNFLLKEQRFSFALWFFVSIITCFIFNVYYEYIMAKAVIELQARQSIRQSNDLPVLSLILSVFGLHVIADAIQQYEINKLLGQ